MKPIVCQLHPVYLALSETFIDRIVGNLQNWRPIVFTEEIQNADHFQFESRYAVRRIERRSSLPARGFAKLLRSANPAVGAYGDIHVRYSLALAKLRPQVLHAHFGPAGWFAAPLRRLHKTPLLVSFHGVDASALLRQPVWRERYQELFQAADCITAPSDRMATRLQEAGCPADKLQVVHYGIDVDAWPFQPPRQDPANDNLQLLMVSRLVEKKGVLYALRALAEVRQSLPGVRLLVAGDGELRSLIEQTIRKLDLAEAVDLLGFVSNREIRDLMYASDALLAPSVTAQDGDEEGLPNVLLEAAAVGLPIVATDHAGTPELIRHAETGLLVPERDEYALADSIVTFARNPRLRYCCAVAARNAVAGEYNLRHTVSQLESLYAAISAA